MVLYVVAALIRAPYAQKVKKIKVRYTKSLFKEYSFLMLVAIGQMILPLFVVFSTYLDRFSMGLSTWLRVLGVLGFAFGVYIMSWAHIALKLNWTPVLQIHVKHKLVVNGPYKYVRHPMYAGFWLWSLFQGLLLDNWMVFVVGLISFSLLYFVRVGKEEEMMVKEFGDEYREYMEKVPRMVPKFKK